MPTPEVATGNQQNKNGLFLAQIEPLAAQDSVLAGAVNTVAERYIDSGNLGDVLAVMKDHNINVLSDYWQNGALDGLDTATEASGFNDAVSAGNSRAKEDYLTPEPVIGSNPLNADPRFPGLRPKGFEIPEAKEPVMAIVALDPTKLDPSIDADAKEKLIKKIDALRIIASDENRKIEAVNSMSNELRGVLASCLLTKNAFVETRDESGATKEWDLPFDMIASLKALHTLLSGKDSSGEMRQGAVRMSAPSGEEIIVGCSGLNSAIDEMVARNFASEVLAEQSN